MTGPDRRFVPPSDVRFHVLVVGGGASGVLAAAHLLERPGSLCVTLIEERELLGCGVAYSTNDPAHLLNTRVASMSAFPDRPDHFLDWLRSGPDPLAHPDGFVARGTYGRYLASLLVPWQGSARLSCLHASCRGAEEPARGGIAAHLSDGRVRVLLGDAAILATGHALPEAGSHPLIFVP
jgi:uncharacterized NAD(P)/FAD-binding protein YdhS